MSRAHPAPTQEAGGPGGQREEDIRAEGGGALSLVLGGRLLSLGSSEHVSQETHPQDRQSDEDVRLCKGLKILASADARGR